MSNLGYEAVPYLGMLAALSLLTTAMFSVFRQKFKNWMKYHKTAAYTTIGLMLLHGGLVLYGRFF